MRRAPQVALAVMLTALMLAGCGRAGGQPPSSSISAVPSVLVSSTMQNPQGIAAGYGKLTITALDPANGGVRWRYQTDWHPYQQVSAPVVAAGIVYIVSDPVPPANRCSNIQGNLVALRESDGRPLWSAALGAFPTPPVVANGVVYTSALNVDQCATPSTHQETKSYYALRAADGHQLWRTDLTQDTTNPNPDASVGLVDTSLQVADDALYVTSETTVSESGARVGHLLALDAATGKPRWKTLVFSDQSIHSILANGLLFVRTHPANAPTVDWTAYRASDGQQVLKVSGAYFGQFLVTGGAIYADASLEAAASTPQQPLFDSQVIALDASTGQPLWRVTAATNDVNGIDALLAVSDNTVYMQTGPSAFAQTAAGHWRIEAVDARTGNIRWSAPLQWLLGRFLLTDTALLGFSDDLLPGHVLALDPRDGHTIWSTALGSAPGGGALGTARSLVQAAGTLYAADESGTVTAIRTRDGAVLWHAKVMGSELEMSTVE